MHEHDRPPNYEEHRSSSNCTMKLLLQLSHMQVARMRHATMNAVASAIVNCATMKEVASFKILIAVMH